MTSTAGVAGRVDCTCPRARHAHGTRKAYNQDGCRCVDCRAAKAADDRRARVERTPPAWEPRAGTRRRLQALAADGWSLTYIAQHAHLSRDEISKLRTSSSDRILITTATHIRAVYERLWPLSPPPGYSSDRAQRTAEAAGWAASWRWEGIDIDDPAAEPLPDGADELDEVLVERLMLGHLRLPKFSHSPERIEAIRRLAAAGLADPAIGQRVGMRAHAVMKTRLRHDIPAGTPKTRDEVAA